MKRTTLSFCLMLFASGIFMLSSCTKADVTFDLPLTVTTNSFGPYVDHTSHEATTGFVQNLDSIVSAHGGSLDRLKKIEISNVTITSVDQPNFAGFSTVEVRLKNGTDNIKLAYKNSPSQTDKTITLEKSAFDDVAGYLKSSACAITLYDYNDGAVLANRATIKATFTVTISGK